LAIHAGQRRRICTKKLVGITPETPTISKR
jgi:hypothetical protein